MPIETQSRHNYESDTDNNLAKPELRVITNSVCANETIYNIRIVVRYRNPTREDYAYVGWDDTNYIDTVSSTSSHNNGMSHGKHEYAENSVKHNIDGRAAIRTQLKNPNNRAIHRDNIFKPLSEAKDIYQKLEKSLINDVESAQIDGARLVNDVAIGKPITNIYHCKAQCRARFLQIIIDRSERLTPYWHDQDFVCQFLLEVLRNDVEISIMHEGLSEPRIIQTGHKETAKWVPKDGGTVLVLGDIGCLSIYRDRDIWNNIIDIVARNRAKFVVLFPASRHRVAYPDDPFRP